MFENDFDRVCIVSIIGKSALSSINSKASQICKFVGQNTLLNGKTNIFKDLVCFNRIQF